MPEINYNYSAMWQNIPEAQSSSILPRNPQDFQNPIYLFPILLAITLKIIIYYNYNSTLKSTKIYIIKNLK
jgi:hypothetical protein